MTVLVLTGGTCSGKSTLAKELVRLGFAELISHTTRSPRPGEIRGKSYHFIVVDEFARMNEEGKFIEVNQLGEHWYGKSQGALEIARRKAEHVVAIVEPNGAAALRAHCAKNGLLLLTAWLQIDKATQRARLAERNATLAPDEVEARMKVIQAVEVGWPGDMEIDMVLDAVNNSPGYLAELVATTIGTSEADSHGF